LDRPAGPAPAAPATRDASGADGPDIGVERNDDPLNFRVPTVFRREFKTYAAQHDLKLVELLQLAFAAYRRQQRD
jgi:hypothetical protein